MKNSHNKILDAYKNTTMNEIRVWLYEAGVEFSDDASREELIALMEKTLKN
jgi:hypothetical protein|nr:MAG TPA: Thymopoietin protein [Caudoviricetes sp.]